ncbi:MAG: hypothetical protein IJ060_08695 [Oscillospiraceae bacterium]|nr:hypothetical protein [Oscillospiraceae bacterium]
MNLNIAVLGLPSSGKTALIEAFERDKEMFVPRLSIGEPTILHPDENRPFAEKVYPVSIDGSEQHTVSVTEYPGELLQKNEENDAEREKMYRSLLTKSSWIIMLDGAWFQSEQEDMIEKTIRKKYARIIVPLVSDYADAHDGQAPELLFVASKVSTYLVSYLNDEGRQKFGRIVESAFGGLVSEMTKPLILLSDTSVRTPLVAVLSLMFCQYRNVQETVSGAVSVKLKKVQERRSQLSNKYRIESNKRFKSRSVIQELRQQIQSLNQEESGLSSQLFNPATDLSMRHFGISLHRLMLKNQAMLAGGFDNVAYSYDASREEGYFQTYWHEKMKKINTVVALILFGIMVVTALLFPENEDQSLLGGIIGGAFWGAVALFVENKAAKILGVIGVLGGFMVSFGVRGVIFVALYVGWYLLSGKLADSLEEKRAVMQNIPKQVRYKDELVQFYDNAVRKG